MQSKFFSIGAVFALLVVGLFQISGVVQDRQTHRASAVRSIAQSVAGTQTLIGPMIHSACVEEWDSTPKEGSNRYTSTSRREFMHVALPTSLAVKGGSQLEPRGRGLHTAQVFTLKAQIAARSRPNT